MLIQTAKTKANLLQSCPPTWLNCTLYRVEQKSVNRFRSVTYLTLSESLSFAAYLIRVYFCLGLLFRKLSGNVTQSVMRVQNSVRRKTSTIFEELCYPSIIWQQDATPLHYGFDVWALLSVNGMDRKERDY